MTCHTPALLAPTWMLLSTKTEYIFSEVFPCKKEWQGIQLTSCFYENLDLSLCPAIGSAGHQSPPSSICPHNLFCVRRLSRHSHTWYVKFTCQVSQPISAPITLKYERKKTLPKNSAPEFSQASIVSLDNQPHSQLNLTTNGTPKQT